MLPSIKQIQTAPLRLLAMLEANTVNAVAKNVLDFCQCARALNQKAPGSVPIETSIVTFDRTPIANSSGLSQNEFVSTARELGITIDVIPERFRFDTRVIPSLRGLISKRAPDVIATHNLKSHFLTRMCGLHRDRPWVAFHHGYTQTDLKMRAYNQLNRWSLRGADRVVTVCGPFAVQLQERGVLADRIIVQHNSIGSLVSATERDVRQVRERFGIKNGHRLIVAVGRLSKEKGHVDLVLAFSLLRIMRPAIVAKLMIVGEGPERTAIEAAIRVHGLQDHVCLGGYMRDVRPYYAAADAFALPSHSEGSPYVLLEAMTAGVPVVATTVGGVPEILTNEETALLVEPHNARSLAIALARILDDTALAKRIASNASTLVSRHYSLEAYVRSLSNIYCMLAFDTNQHQRQRI